MALLCADSDTRFSISWILSEIADLHPSISQLTIRSLLMQKVAASPRNNAQDAQGRHSCGAHLSTE